MGNHSELKTTNNQTTVKGGVGNEWIGGAEAKTWEGLTQKFSMIGPTVQVKHGEISVSLFPEFDYVQVSMFLPFFWYIYYKLRGTGLGGGWSSAGILG